MSIDINDYTSRLNATRQEYARKADDLERSYDKNVDNLKKTHDYRTNSQRKAYDSQLSDIEQNTNELNQRLRSEQANDLSKMREDYKSSLEGEKVAFQKRFDEMNQDLRSKLSNARDSYEASVKNLDRQDKNYNANRDKDFFNRLESQRVEHANEVDTLNKKIQTTLRNLDREKTIGNQKLRQENSKRLNDLQENNATKLSDLRTRYDRLFGEASDTFRKQTDNMRSDHYNKQLNLAKNLRNDGSLKYKEFTSKMANQESQNKENLKNIRQEYNDKIKKNNALNLKEMERVKRGYEKRLADVEPYIETNDRKSIFTVNKKEISNLKQRLVSERENFKLESDKLRKSSEDKVADARNRYQKKTIERESEFNVRAKNVVNQVNKEKEELVDSYNLQLARTKANKNREVTQIRENGQRRLEKKTNELGRQINIMDKTNKALIADLQKTAGEEKSTIIKNAANKLATEKELLRKDLEGKFNEIINSYDLKLTNLSAENKMMKEKFDLTVRDLETQKKQLVNEEKMRSQETKRILRASFTEELGRRELDFKNSLSKLKAQYDKKLSEDKMLTDRSMRKLASEMNNQSRLNQLQHKKELQKMERDYQKMIGDLNRSNQVERDRIVRQYEEKLDKLKDVVKTEQEKLSDMRKNQNQLA